MTQPVRMWINQPSKRQPLHHLHGTNVLAVPAYPKTMRIYFLSGPVVSQQALTLWLSPGWLKDRRHLEQARLSDTMMK